MSAPALLDEHMLPGLLAQFYHRVREDAQLGPVFHHAVQDWPAHLERLADFWSSVMLSSGRYKGNPMRQHMKHADQITPAMFARWLELWAHTTQEMLPAGQAHAMREKAHRIAQSLQLGLQTQRGELPPKLPAGQQATV